MMRIFLTTIVGLMSCDVFSRPERGKNRLISFWNETLRRTCNLKRLPYHLNRKITADEVTETCTVLYSCGRTPLLSGLQQTKLYCKMAGWLAGKPLQTLKGADMIEEYSFKTSCYVVVVVVIVVVLNKTLTQTFNLPDESPDSPRWWRRRKRPSRRCSPPRRSLSKTAQKQEEK